MSEPIDTAALRKLLADAEGFHPLQGSPASLLMVALMALLDEVERLELAVQSCPDCEDLATDCIKAEDRATKLEVEVERLRECAANADSEYPFERLLHQAEDKQARIDAALELLPDLLHTQDCKWQQARPCDCAKGEVRKAITGEKTATAKELIEGTQKLTFKEKDEATGFIPLQIDKTYEEDQ